MKNLNKVLALLVVFMMMLSTVAFASFSDVADSSSYSTAIEVGVDLGLIKGYEDGTFKPEGEITRAEFAAIVVRLLGQEAQVEGAKASTQFTDVPADHWAAGYVNIAVQAGVVNGYGNGMFGPEDLVEYQDAITMMVRALGYEPAIGSAGYPTGYLTKAGELGLTSNVNGTNGVAANRGAVAQIAFNALDVALMTQSGYGTFTQYVINDGYSSTSGNINVKKTLLSENHKTVKVQGIVNSASVATSTNKNADEYVTVSITNYMNNKWADDIEDLNGKIYVGESDAANYVGKKVVMFIAYDEFENKATMKSLYEVKTDALVIDLADVSDITTITKTVGEGKDAKTEITGYEVKYYITESKTTTVTLSADTDFYYNGVKDADNAKVWSKSADVAELKKMSGTIELDLLKDSTTDGDYDTAFVTANYIFVVDEVKASTGRVTSKLEDADLTKISFNEDDGDVKATLVDANGAAMDWTSLNEYDVLSVKWVDTGVKDMYEAKIISNTVEGTVTGLSGTKGDDDRYVEIDGTEYKVLAVAEDDIIKLGDVGTYYLDENNNVVYHNATISKNNNYAYVISVYVPTGDKANFDSVEVKALTMENGVVKVNVASKVTVSFEGDKVNNVITKDFAASLTEKDPTLATKIAEAGYSKIEEIEGKVVAYKLNTSGEISTIEIPSTTTTDDYDYFVYNYKKVDLTKYDPDDMTFKIGNKTYNLTSNTVIFYVPEGGVADDDFEVVALSNLAEGQDLYDVDVYDIDEDDNISVMALKGKDNEITGSTDNAAFITKVSKVQDEDGYDVTRVTAYVGGSVVTYTCDDGVASDSMVGKLYVPTYKANGDVNAFTAVENYSNKALEIKGYAGELKALNTDNDVELESPTTSKKVYLDGDIDKVYKISGANIYVYDATSSARTKYTIDADAAYFDYDDDDDYKLFVDDDCTNVKAKAYLYEVDGDIVDVVYYIYESK